MLVVVAVMVVLTVSPTHMACPAESGGDGCTGDVADKDGKPKWYLW